MDILQEKFQVAYGPTRDDNGDTWVSDKSARTRKGTPAGTNINFQSLPPGSDIIDQEVSDIRKMRTITAGTDDVTDNPTASAFRGGFVKLSMKPTDDMYTREHNDAFYDDVGGFSERNNMLDRM